MAASLSIPSELVHGLEDLGKTLEVGLGLCGVLLHCGGLAGGLCAGGCALAKLREPNLDQAVLLFDGSHLVCELSNIGETDVRRGPGLRQVLLLVLQHQQCLGGLCDLVCHPLFRALVDGQSTLELSHTVSPCFWEGMGRQG